MMPIQTPNDYLPESPLEAPTASRPFIGTVVVLAMLVAIFALVLALSAGEGENTGPGPTEVVPTSVR